MLTVHLAVLLRTVSEESAESIDEHHADRVWRKVHSSQQHPELRDGPAVAGARGGRAGRGGGRGHGGTLYGK